MTDLEKLEEAAKVEANLLSLVLKERDRKIKEAESAIVEEYYEKVVSARQRSVQADKDLRNHKSETASHPWEGKRVKRVKIDYTPFSYQSTRTEIYGIVEVGRIGTRFPENLAGYSLPSIGEPFVRLLLKNGKPGKRFDRCYKSIEDSGWELDD